MTPRPSRSCSLVIEQGRDVSENPHFTGVESWTGAEALVDFPPAEPGHTAGFTLQSLRIHVMDHHERELPIAKRTLEAHYGGFVLSQARPGAAEARRLALEVSYGAEALEASVAGHQARSYESGPEVEPEDVDGQMPAVVVWPDGDVFFLIASGELDRGVLIRIAASLYPRG